MLIGRGLLSNLLMSYFLVFYVFYSCLETLNDIIGSIKLLILKRFRDGQLNSPALSTNQPLEAILDQLISKKYSM